MYQTRTLRIAAAGGTHELEARVQSPAAAARAAVAAPIGKVVIAPPHPLYGGDIDNPVVRELETAFLERGFETLAFDFRGSGGSSGTQHGGMDDACADFVSVARAEAAQPLVALAGYSFGACAAVHAAVTLGVTSLVLVAPALGLLDPAALSAYAGRLFIVVGDQDEYAPVAALESALAHLADTQLRVLPDVDHFFMGSQRVRLREALKTVAVLQPGP
jgi:alpha/beta superfamily hydrolase